MERYQRGKCRFRFSKVDHRQRNWLNVSGCMDADILKNDPVLAEIVRRLLKAYEPQRIYLFGSKARGDAGPDSDYDLMVVVPDDAPPERRRSRHTRCSDGRGGRRMSWCGRGRASTAA